MVARPRNDISRLRPLPKVVPRRKYEVMMSRVFTKETNQIIKTDQFLV
jgi:hypothetical protein